jgi:predicted dehydrogenase
MRVVMIEVGHWHAAMHLRALRLAGAAIAGVSDRQLEVAAHFATEIGCPAYADHREMLAEVRPDFALVLGRHVELPALSRDVIEAGIPCAIEKPAGVSSEQLAPVVDLARQRGAFVAVPFTNRYSELWAWLARLERAGRAGPRAHAHFRIVNGPPNRYERDGVSWMLDPAVSGGGAMRNLGIHAVDAFLHYAAGQTVTVLGAAVSCRIYGRAVEEFATALLRSENGVIGTVEAGYTYAAMSGGDFEWRVAAGNCYLVDRGPTLEWATLDDGRRASVEIPDQRVRYDRFAGDTLARLRAGQRPVATLEDCYRAMRVVDQIYQVATSTDVPRSRGPST